MVLSKWWFARTKSPKITHQNIQAYSTCSECIPLESIPSPRIPVTTRIITLVRDPNLNPHILMNSSPFSIGKYINLHSSWIFQPQLCFTATNSFSQGSQLCPILLRPFIDKGCRHALVGRASQTGLFIHGIDVTYLCQGVSGGMIFGTSAMVAMVVVVSLISFFVWNTGGSWGVESWNLSHPPKKRYHVLK